MPEQGGQAAVMPELAQAAEAVAPAAISDATPALVGRGVND